MSTVLEIERAIERLPAGQQKALLSHLAMRLGRTIRPPHAKKRTLKAAAQPPLEGLPPDLSVNTRDRVKRLVARRHATDR